MRYSKLLLLSLTAGSVLAPASLSAQAVSSSAEDTTTCPPDDTVELSPFEVTTDQDKGYRTTNTISGTRLNTAIKDLPMPIEVITEDFLRDTGSTDLRQALRYSSGILLQTQNDYAAASGSFSSSPGKINNPEGLTASPTQTNMKIRGFQTESVLRDGFRRQNATDSVNVSRIEVVRGPASLLYGVGNFGGVVNYFTKQPLKERATEISATYGSYDLVRGTIDHTGPITASGNLAYRITGAAQKTGSYTDFGDERHFFVSPVITWEPFENTQLLLDIEYGKQKHEGIGWQTLRAAVSGFVNDSAGYNGNFLEIPGRDVREFRWSGPDTFRDSTASNVLLKVTQKLTDNLHFSVGVNRGTFDFEQRDNLAALRMVTGTGVPEWAIAPVTYAGLTSTQSGVPVGPQPSTIGYQWELQDQDHTHDQVRADLMYQLKLFEHGSSKWLRVNNSFLAGFNYTKETAEIHTRQTPGDVTNYHSPADYSYFRYGRQGDGSPDHPLVEWNNSETITSNPALYAVYQGKLLDERLTLIAGARRDRSWNTVWQYNPEYNSDGTPRGDTEPTFAHSGASRDTTYQFGASLAITPGRELSIYAMRAEGIQPNYQGKLDLYGQPIKAALATNKELGLKFDLFGGRLSGTISKFEITRTRAQVGSSSLVWYAPVVSDNLKFDPNKDIVYRVDELNPVGNEWNGAVQASADQWNTAVAAGSIYQATNSNGETHWYANASQASGAAYLDALFANVHELKQYGWWGWLYGGADPGSQPFDSLVNNATMDDNGEQRSVATGSDRSEGWDTQVIWSPTDELQIVATWSHIEKKVLNAQAWAKYPYPQDRWAIWYAPISWAATAGRPLSEVYTDPTDTSTYIAFGTGLPMDDTPEDQGTFWINYQFPKKSALKGLSLGFGGSYESERIVYPAYGQNALDNQGNSITLVTPERVLFNAMIKYDFTLRGRESSVQLNVENLENDRDLYGFIYQAPRRWQIEFTHKL